MNMNQVPEKQLEEILKKLTQVTNINQASRLTTVRWFNRLYYDVRHWNETFISFLKTYPGFKQNPKESEFKNFKRKLEEYLNSLSERYGEVKNDLCTNLKILSARYPKDFQWLYKQDENLYWEIRDTLDLSYASESLIMSIAGTVCMSVGSILNSSDWGITGRESIKKQIEDYERESKEHTNNLHSFANSVGIHLLSVEEYEMAIQEDGASNPKIFIIGEITTNQTFMEKNEFKGNTVYAKDNAKITNFTQNYVEGLDKDDLKTLSEELSILRKELKLAANGKDEYDGPIGAVANAEDAAKKGDKKGVLNFLKSAGKWALDTATKIGTDVAVKAIKDAIG